MIEANQPERETTPRLLTYRQAGHVMQVTDRMIGKLVKTGRLPCIRIGRSVRIDMADLDRFIADRKCKAAATSA